MSPLGVRFRMPSRVISKKAGLMEGWMGREAGSTLRPRVGISWRNATNTQVQQQPRFHNHDAWRRVGDTTRCAREEWVEADVDMGFDERMRKETLGSDPCVVGSTVLHGPAFPPAARVVE